MSHTKNAQAKVASASSSNGKWEVVTEKGSSFNVVRSRMTSDEREDLSIDRRLSDIDVPAQECKTESE